MARPTVLRRELEQTLPDRPFAIEFWDGSALPATNGAGGPSFRVKSPQALAHALRAPGQLGLGRAYVAGDLEVDDLDGVIALLDGWKPPPLDRRARARLALAAVRAAGLTKPPRRPDSELVPRGRRHSKERDARSVRHHYDVSNEFFALFLDESMTYSCALFRDGAQTLEEAQRAKHEMVCRKLALAAGERVLDVGCGWGAFALHAAREHGVHVTGITLSEPQARLARERAEAAGVGDRVEIRVMDYRDVPTSDAYDAVASIGMVEHVGAVQIADYAQTLTHWIDRLDANLDEARRLAGDERVRVWRLYLRAARNGFQTGFTSIYQARCSLPARAAAS